MLVGLLAAVLRLAGLIMPIADEVWRLPRALFWTFGRFLDRVERGPWLAPEMLAEAGVTLVLILPGALCLLGLWVWARRTLTSEHGEALAHWLGAREPRPDDREERQLMNLVAEMAVAAGLSPPGVLILDGPGATVAALGRSEADATIVLSRSILDHLDRASTQAVIGHIVASVGDGDTRLSAGLVGVAATFGLLITLLDAPFSAQARASLARLRDARRSATSTVATSLLGTSLDERRLEEMQRELTSDLRGARARFTRLLLLPLMVTNLFARMVIALMGGLVLGPALAWASRTRRLLADATAVRLTRDPDALARGLKWLSTAPAPAPEAGALHHVLIVPPDLPPDRPSSSDALASLGAGITSLRFHPPVEQRLACLTAMGAQRPAPSEGLFAGGRQANLGAIGAFVWRAVLGLLFIGPVGLVFLLSFLLFAIGMAFVGDVLLP
jgi:Zn-dependent protease with chaperone function